MQYDHIVKAVERTTVTPTTITYTVYEAEGEGLLGNQRIAYTTKEAATEAFVKKAQGHIASLLEQIEVWSSHIQQATEEIADWQAKIEEAKS